MGLGLLIRNREPSMLGLPDPQPLDDVDAGPVVKAAHAVRDTLHEVVPENLAQTLARSMMVTGAAMVLVRALDEATGAASRR